MIGELDRDLIGVLDHVRIGQHQAIGADDEARALPVHGHALWRLTVALIATRIEAEQLAEIGHLLAMTP